MVRLSNPLETTSLLYMGAGSDSSGVVALEKSLSKKGIGEGKVMMTFGVTGSVRHCDAAYQLQLIIVLTSAVLQISLVLERIGLMVDSVLHIFVTLLVQKAMLLIQWRRQLIGQKFLKLQTI